MTKVEWRQRNKNKLKKINKLEQHIIDRIKNPKSQFFKNIKENINITKNER